jgi:WXXGXW repeat (2 copies)
MTRTLVRFFGLVVGLTVALSACVASGQATMGVDTTPVVYQDPPPPKAETYSTRPGFVFVKGRWNWQNGQWVWVAGHWDRERAGYAWNDGRWERRGNRWEWIEGTWAVSSGPPPVTAQGGVSVSSGGPPPRNEPHPVAQGGVSVSSSSSEYPTAAPPPLRSESQAARAGFVWVSGRWDWKSGTWAWVDGHWERERANQAWVAGRWEMQGNRWIWVEGRWEKSAAGPVVRDHR